jgi:hypothetical protein
VHAGWLMREAERRGLSPVHALLAALDEAREAGWPTR